MKKLIENLSSTINKYFFPFYRNKDIKLLFKNLEEGKSKNKEVAMFVGGCVRNYLRSKKIGDIDIATILTSEESFTILSLSSKNAPGKAALITSPSVHK